MPASSASMTPPGGIDAATLKPINEGRPYVHQRPVLWQPPDCSTLASKRVPGRPSSCAPPDGHHGAASHLQGTQQQQEAPSAPDLSVLAEKAAGHAHEPRLVQRYNIHPCAARVPLSGRDHGLGPAQGAVLAVVKHAGCQLLCRGFERGSGQFRQQSRHNPSISRSLPGYSRTQSALSRISVQPGLQRVGFPFVQT